MIIDFKGYRFRLHCSLQKYVDVEGINSNIIGSDNHILIWDFDNTPLPQVIDSLLALQGNWELPPIYIVQSSPEHYHAYCFKLLPMPQVICILATTKGICSNFFKFGILRGYWTLRITPEKGTFKKMMILDSKYKPDKVDLSLLETAKYRTKINWRFKNDRP